MHPDLQQPVFDRRRVRGAFSHVGLAALLFLLANGATGVLAMLLPSDISKNLLTLLTYLVLYGLGTLCFYLAVRPLPCDIAPRTSIPFSVLLAYLCVGYLFLLMGSLVGTAVTSAIGADSPVETYLLEADVWVNLLPLVVLAPVCEELMFRKLLLDRTAQYGQREALILSALLFALMHGNFSQAFYAFGLGLVLAALYLRTRNILYPILVHAFVNLVQGVLPTLLEQRFGGNEAETAAALLPVTLLAFGLAAAGLVLLIRYRGRTLFKKSNIPHVGRLIYGNAGVILFGIAAAAMFAAFTWLTLQ